MKLWHYTIPQLLPSIIESGVLRPATKLVPAHETPVVWFSARQRWEPTAAKAGLRTLDQMAAQFGTMVRFGIEREKALQWRRLVPAIGMDADTRRGLERAGRDVGADPADWYGVIGPVAVRDLTPQHFDGEWR